MKSVMDQTRESEVRLVVQHCQNKWEQALWAWGQWEFGCLHPSSSAYDTYLEGAT
jgi:hypothetical protein